MRSGVRQRGLCPPLWQHRACRLLWERFLLRFLLSILGDPDPTLEPRRRLRSWRGPRRVGPLPPLHVAPASRSLPCTASPQFWSMWKEAHRAGLSTAAQLPGADPSQLSSCRLSLTRGVMGNSGQPVPAMARAPSLRALTDLGLCPRSPVSPLWWRGAGLGCVVRQRLQSSIPTLAGHHGGGGQRLGSGSYPSLAPSQSGHGCYGECCPCQQLRVPSVLSPGTGVVCLPGRGLRAACPQALFCSCAVGVWGTTTWKLPRAAWAPQSAPGHLSPQGSDSPE